MAIELTRRPVRVGVLYSTKRRPDTTGTYYLAALRRDFTAIGVEAFHIDHKTAFERPREPADLYLRIDDAHRYAVPRDYRPLAFVVSDTHMPGPWRLERARDADLVFTNQRDGTLEYRARGVRAIWSPHAMEPEMHGPVEVPARAADIVFVGNINTDERRRFADAFAARFGQRARFVSGVFGRDMARAYSEARCGFNMSVNGDVNMRFFEVLAAGALLVTDDLSANGMFDLVPRNACAVYDGGDPASAITVIERALADDAKRARMAALGQAIAMARHTYRHRIENILVHAGLARWLPEPEAEPPEPCPHCGARLLVSGRCPTAGRLVWELEMEPEIAAVEEAAARSRRRRIAVLAAIAAATVAAGAAALFQS